MDIQTRRQFESNNSVERWEWMFPADVTLYTTEIPGMKKYWPNLAYMFESCVFRPDSSDVLERYNTYEEAKQGHLRLTKELGLGFVAEQWIQE